MNPHATVSHSFSVWRPGRGVRSTLAVALCSVLLLLAAEAPASAQPVSFNAPLSLPVGSNPGSVAVGDFNGDTDPDLAVVGDVSGTVSILLGAVGGSFTGPSDITVGGLPGSVAVGEFNGDSDPDLAVANRASDNVSILLGAAGGS